MRKRTMQEVPIPGVFPNRKKRIVQGKTPTKVAQHSKGDFTKLKPGYSPSQAVNSSDSGPEIGWDNNSPSPAKESNRATRKGKSGKGIKDLLKKIRTTNKNVRENKDPKDHSLFDVWMQAGPELTEALNKDCINLSPEREEKKTGKTKYRGKTPRRLVGRQRSRIQTIDPKFQDEFCKLVMALSGPQDGDCCKQNKNIKPGNAEDKDDVNLDEEFFEEDIEPLDLLQEEPKNKVDRAGTLKKSQNSSTTILDQDLGKDMFSDDDFDDVVLQDTGQEPFAVNETAKDAQKLQRDGRSAAVNTTTLTNIEPKLGKNSHSTVSQGVHKGDLSIGDDDLFGDEDMDLSIAFQNLEEPKSGYGMLTRQAAKMHAVAHEKSVTERRSRYSQTPKRQPIQSISKEKTYSSKSCTTSQNRNATDSSPHWTLHSQTANQLLNKRNSPLCSIKTSSRDNVSNLKSSRREELSPAKKHSPSLFENTPEEDEIFATLPLEELPMTSTQKCNESQIEEKRRLALEKLAKKQLKGAGCSSDILTRKTRQR